VGIVFVFGGRLVGGVVVILSVWKVVDVFFVLGLGVGLMLFV